MTTLVTFCLLTLVWFIGGGVGWYLRGEKDDKILKELITDQEKTYLEACDKLKECNKNQFKTEEEYLMAANAKSNVVKYEYSELHGLKTARTSIW